MHPRVAPGAAPFAHGLKSACGSAAFALFCLALAEPQCGTRTELAKRYGIDLVVALDASRSMLAKDIKPSRLERAKLELASLLDRLHGDRVGIVVFAGDAFTQCPLTTDYAAAKMFLKAIDANALPMQGTNIARALEESKDLLVNSERGAKARAIVLLTDGEETADGDTQKILNELEPLSVRVLTVGIGSTAGEPIQELDKKGNMIGYKKDKAGNTVVTRLDEAGLIAIAEKTGGKYIHSLTGVGVQEIYEELDRLDKQEFESRLTVKYSDRYYYAAFPGFLLLLVGAALRPGRREGVRS
jgi:Ca-activated chloride channel family protein